MNILLVKTSSLGDVVHNLPVVSDIVRHFPNARIDWCVEEAFSDIPRLHPKVDRIVPVAVRRWRQSLGHLETWRQMRGFRHALRETAYDAIIDSQGLIKSALLVGQARLAPQGRRTGFCRRSIKEAPATLLYHQTCTIAREKHAIVRNRRVAAVALGYADDPLLGAAPDYGIRLPDESIRVCAEQHGRFAVLLTATSRDAKLWPEADWIALGRYLAGQGIQAQLPAGNVRERERAIRIAAAVPGACVVPPSRIADLAVLMAVARLVIGVDTGLAHLAAAIGTPTVALYMNSDPGRVGVVGAEKNFTRNLGEHGRIPGRSEVFATVDQALENA